MVLYAVRCSLPRNVSSSFYYENESYIYMHALGINQGETLGKYHEEKKEKKKEYICMLSMPSYM